MKLNIVKEYTIDTPFDVTLSKLECISSAGFTNSQYSIFGNTISLNPAEFLFMAKWAAFFSSPLAKFTSTRIFVKLVNFNNKSKITVKAMSNPIAIFIGIFCIVVTLIKLFTYKTSEDLKLAAVYFCMAVATWLFDKFLKNIVIASFERDLKLAG